MKSSYNPNSKILRAFIVISMAIGTIILLPVILLSLPFYFSWNLSSIILESAMMKENDKEDAWKNFSIDFNSWKKASEK